MTAPGDDAADQRRLHELLARYAPVVMPEPVSLEVSCGIGWYELLETFLDKAAEIGHRTGACITIMQVKQKFGGLRIYCHVDADDAASEALQDAAKIAERASFTICEVCGASGRLRRYGGGVLTLCEMHRRESRQRSRNGTNA